MYRQQAVGVQAEAPEKAVQPQAWEWHLERSCWHSRLWWEQELVPWYSAVLGLRLGWEAAQKRSSSYHWMMLRWTEWRWCC